MNTRTLTVRPLHPRAALEGMTRTLADAFVSAGRGLWSALEAHGKRRAARELAFTASWMPDDQQAVARVLREQAAEWRSH
jgi:hypothetical protein